MNSIPTTKRVTLTQAGAAIVTADGDTPLLGGELINNSSEPATVEVWVAKGGESTYPLARFVAASAVKYGLPELNYLLLSQGDVLWAKASHPEVVSFAVGYGS